jgi:hypothetical protein
VSQIPQLPQSREQFQTFLHDLAGSLRTDPGEWENRSLRDFILAWEAWCRDMDGFFEGQGQQVPTELSWELLGKMLLSAKVYE